MLHGFSDIFPHYFHLTFFSLMFLNQFLLSFNFLTRLHCTVSRLPATLQRLGIYRER